MMELFLTYILKVAVLLAVLVLLYQLLLSKLTFHVFNRITLILILLFSFTLPAIRISLPERIERLAPILSLSGDESISDVFEPAQNMLESQVVSSQDIVDNTESGNTASASANNGATEKHPLKWSIILFMIYCAGVLYCIIKKYISVKSMLRVIQDGEYRNRFEECDIIESDAVTQPINWMRYIVMPRQWLEMENKAVLQHESLHAHKWHSFDLLFADLAGALQWFNPAMLIVHKEIELIHEYEADRSVIDGGTSENDYKTMLVGTLAANHGYSMSSGFRESNLKKRIDMMERKNSRQVSKLRSAIIVLVAFVFMSLNSVGAAAATEGYPTFEDGRAWIFSDGTAKVRTFDGAEATVKTDELARYLHKYRKFKTTRISLYYMDGVSSLEEVQPLAEQLDKYNIKTAVAIDNYMLEHMTMPEYRRAHIIDLGGGQYRFEMNCEMQENLRYTFLEQNRKFKTLSITGDIDLMNLWIEMFDGHGIAIYPQDMPWADARSMADAAVRRGIDQVAIIYEDPSEAADLTGLNGFYSMYVGDNGPITITPIPVKSKIEAKPDEKAIDVAARLNAAISTDWFEKGERIENPQSMFNRNKPWLHITNVIRTENETVVLFYSWQGNDLWLTSMTGFTMKAGGNEYKETGHYGIDGFEEKYYWSPESGYYYFAVTFPALPDNVTSVDLIDAEDRSVAVRGLQVSNSMPDKSELITMLLYGNYKLQTLNLHDMPDYVSATIAELSETETTVYMEMQIMEPHSVKGYVGNEFTLTLANGKELNSLRVEGVKTDVDFDRGGDHVTNYFQVVFPATTPMEWMEGRSTLNGVICHEPIKLELTAALKTNGEENIEDIDKIINTFIIGASTETLKVTPAN